MRVRIGDIVEIETSKGFAYAIYTHRHTAPPKFGAMIRVFEGLHHSRPADVAKLVETPIQFTVFYPVQGAVNKGYAKIAANVPIPAHLKPFPLFRDGIADPQTKKVAVWHLWDGEKSWKVGQLSAEERRIPIREVWNHAMLIHRVEEGWRPEIDVS